MSETYSIVLGAGLSSRFVEGSKLLYPYKGKPMVHHTIDLLLTSDVKGIIVVTGAYADQMSSSLAESFSNKRLTLVDNSEYGLGMASSIKFGLSHVPTGANCLICLADMPNVQAKTIKLLLDRSVENPNAYAWIPSHKNNIGNPILFHHASCSDLMSLDGDTGAKELLKIHSHVVDTVPVIDAGIHQDFDTIQAFDNAI